MWCACVLKVRVRVHVYGLWCRAWCAACVVVCGVGVGVCGVCVVWCVVVCVCCCVCVGVVWHAETLVCALKSPRVCVQNVPVCAGSMPTCLKHVGMMHGNVLNAHTGTFSMHTR